MSTNNQAPAAPQVPQVMDGQSAFNLLQQSIFYPAFLQKVAAAGIVFQTPAEQLAAIEQGEALLRLWEDNQAKTAAAGDPVLARMMHNNQANFQNAGLSPASPQLQMTLQKNAYAWAENPTIAAAALSLELIARERQQAQ